MNDALCREIGPDLFFPDGGGGSAIARQVCGKCAVKTQCLDFALSFPSMIGIWGGTTERQRRKLPKTYQEEQ